MQLHPTPTGGLDVLVADAQYGPAVLLKCFYWYGREFAVAITPAEAAGYTRVRLTPKTGALTVEETAALGHRIHNDLIDFSLREIIAAETRPVRELLIAKAFAPFDTQQPPQSEVADPVGFDPAFRLN